MSWAGLALLAALPAAAGQVKLSQRGPVALGHWIGYPVGRILESFSAKPGETYRLELEWADPQGQLEVELSAGTLPEDQDVDEAVGVVSQRASGHRRAVIELAVPAGGNAVWFAVRPAGNPQQGLRLRLTRVAGKR